MIEHVVDGLKVAFKSQQLQPARHRELLPDRKLLHVTVVGLCRVATTGLLALLCATYPGFHIIFILLIALDIFSHWFQMYSTLLAGSTTHKVSSSPVQPQTRAAV